MSESAKFRRRVLTDNQLRALPEPRISRVLPWPLSTSAVPGFERKARSELWWVTWWRWRGRVFHVREVRIV